MGLGLKTAQRFGAILAGLAGLLLFVAAPYIGQDAAITRADEPVINYQFPEEGDTLKEPPFVLQMCFEQPVNVNDLDKGGDFRFRLLRPDNKGLGMRIIASFTRQLSATIEMKKHDPGAEFIVSIPLRAPC